MLLLLLRTQMIGWKKTSRWRHAGAASERTESVVKDGVVVCYWCRTLILRAATRTWMCRHNPFWQNHWGVVGVSRTRGIVRGRSQGMSFDWHRLVRQLRARRPVTNWQDGWPSDPASHRDVMQQDDDVVRRRFDVELQSDESRALSVIETGHNRIAACPACWRGTVASGRVTAAAGSLWSMLYS